jgi:serine protease
MKLLAAFLISFVISSYSLFSQSKPISAKLFQTDFKIPHHLTSGNYLEKAVIVKVKPQYNSICATDKIDNPVFNTLYSAIGGTGLSKKFPHTKAPEKLINERGETLTDLTLIYEFNYTASTSLEKVINEFNALQLFEYVEPHYVPHLCYAPNDTGLYNQYAITNIQAEAAWGVNTTTARGDTNVVIGITDTGTEPTHLDLKNNIKHNYADIIGGGDTDGDGYIDNFSGWDLGENDNDPTYNANPHGVHVCGIAAASADNTTGVAGIGFHCKFLPVKIADASGALTKAYEGITYAADHGCAVINCSWGDVEGGLLGQDVINYATINKNALVVAAAGNNAMDEQFYPASYNYVISVAATRNDDRPWPSTNYNYTVDVCAPGESIYSTFFGNSYAYETGTSMASPCAAGAAAIIKSFYPSYTALQVGERLKVTCDNIYPLTTSAYTNRLGNGRIDLYKALTQNASPSVVMTQRNTTDNNDNTFVAGDTLRISGNYTNYLAPTVNLTATLSSTCPYVTIINSVCTLGAINTLGIANNNASPYTIRILAGAPANLVVPFEITYSDPATSYGAIEFFNLTVNVDYVNIAINDVATTINSAGRIGYSQGGQVGGLGFNYNNAGTILYEAGLMIGTSGTQVSDAVRGANVQDADFQSVTTAHAVIPPVFSEFDVDGTFKDGNASSPLPITVHHKAFAWTTSGNRKYVIVQYTITNKGTAPLANLYAGVFADWDIDAATFASDRASFDATDKMGYAYYSGTNGTYAGVKLLTNTAPVVHYAIDNIAGGAGGVDLTSGGYDKNEKYITLSTNRANAGVNGSGGDIADVVSTGPYSIAIGDSIKIAFALIGGDSLSDIQTSAANAQIKYDGLGTTTGIVSNKTNNNTLTIYPNPATNQSMIDISTSAEAIVELKIFTIQGEQIKIIASEKMPMGLHHFTYDTSSLASGLYYCQLMVGDTKQVQKLIIIK